MRTRIGIMCGTIAIAATIAGGLGAGTASAQWDGQMRGPATPVSSEFNSPFSWRIDLGRGGVICTPDYWIPFALTPFPMCGVHPWY